MPCLPRPCFSAFAPPPKLARPAAVLVLALHAGLCAAQPAEPVLQLKQARFFAGDAVVPVPVSLPDTWRPRGQATNTTGHYQISVTLPQAPQSVWALRADRLSTVHELRVNGQLVHGELGAGLRALRPVPTLITLPPGLLHAGENSLVVSVAPAAMTGLSDLHLGPHTTVSAGFQASQRLHVLLPQWLNLVTAGFSLFMLLMWTLRRQEITLGTFGALGFLVSVRNATYFLVSAPVPLGWASWLFFMAQTAGAVLLGTFAMHFSGLRPRWYALALRGVAWGFPPLGLLAMAAGELNTARAWLYPLLMLMFLMPVGLLVRAAWQRRAAAESLLVAGLLVVLVASAHDYLFQLGHTDISDGYWAPYATPGLVAIFATFLLLRLVKALSTVEGMNVALERRVVERTRELQAANAAKTRFLAAASHDLRQPMVSIGLLVGLMREQVGTGPLQRVVQRLQEAAGAMENLLNRLLDLSRLQAGTVRVQRQPVALQALFEGVAATHAEQAQRKGLQLRVRPTAAVVHGDPALLEQVLGNLVGNAVRYTARGGVLLTARRRGPAAWQVAVWDTGPGIAPGQQQAIFGEFVRGENLPEGPASSTGLGLGLAIVQRATELLDTRVELHSQVGRGSRFSLRLPAAPSAPPRPTVPAPAVVLMPLAGLQTWLLEDNEAARASLQMLLQHWGANVRAFASLGALTAAAASPSTAPPPGLLVTDQRLDDGQGTQALMRLRDRWPGTPALIVTGNTAPHELQALEGWREAGVPVLQKPFSTGALLAAVQLALATGRAAQRGDAHDTGVAAGRGHDTGVAVGGGHDTGVAAGGGGSGGGFSRT